MAQLADCLPSMHEALGFDWPTNQRWRQEDLNSKLSLATKETPGKPGLPKSLSQQNKGRKEAGGGGAKMLPGA